MNAPAMDPVLVLPPELVLRICSLLHIYDLTHLWELSRSWRQIVSETSLWRFSELDLGRTWENSHCLKVLFRAPCLGSIFFCGWVSDKLKVALLETKAVVSRIENIPGDITGVDYTGVIMHHRLHLRDLSIWYPSKELLGIIITLPALQKLEIRNGSDGLLHHNCTIEVPGGFTGNLKSFHDDGIYPLQLKPLLSILSAHRSTLEEVHLTEYGLTWWSQGVADDRFMQLMDMLEKCHFTALRRLKLSCCLNNTAEIEAVRRLFPKVDVTYEI